MRTGLVVLALGSVAFASACGDDSDADSGIGADTEETGARDDSGNENGGRIGTGTSDDDPTRGDDDAAGDAEGGVSAQEFCDAYFGIDIDPHDFVAFGEAARQLTPPAEIADDWEGMFEGDTQAIEDVVMWTIANCPQMNP